MSPIDAHAALSYEAKLRARMVSLLGLPYQNRDTWLAIAATLMQLGDVCHQLQRDEQADAYRHKAMIIKGKVQ